MTASSCLPVMIICRPFPAWVDGSGSTMMACCKHLSWTCDPCNALQAVGVGVGCSILLCWRGKVMQYTISLHPAQQGCLWGHCTIGSHRTVAGNAQCWLFPQGNQEAGCLAHTAWLGRPWAHHTYDDPSARPQSDFFE